ncbi:MAG: hypothetical protein ACREQ5_16675, partial [Candidatus Dormibacteria bacterium]
RGALALEAHRGGWDAAGVATAFNGVALEGLEVVFIVLSLGATARAFGPPALGAALALTVVVALGLAVRRPLARVPENALKAAVGTMLSALGTFWLGEGLGADWPGGDLAILALAAGFVAAGALGLALARRGGRAPKQTARGERASSGI